MKCIKCNQSDTQVVDSRPHDNGKTIRRRRKCRNCGYRFTTYESVVIDEYRGIKISEWLITIKKFERLHQQIHLLVSRKDKS